MIRRSMSANETRLWCCLEDVPAGKDTPHMLAKRRYIVYELVSFSFAFCGPKTKVTSSVVICNIKE
jgi:hypothetical protein